MLVVVEDGDIERLLQPVLDLEAAGGRDVLEVDAAEGRCDQFDRPDTDAGGRYQVRAIDLPAGTLRDGVIVDKTNVDEVMAGYPLAQVRRADGGVFTLYRGTEHPLIHALNSVEGWALCSTCRP